MGVSTIPKSKVSKLRAEYQERKISIDTLPEKSASLKTTKSFLTLLIDNGVKAHTQRWNGSIETIKELCTATLGELSKRGFADSLRTCDATQLIDEKTRTELTQKMMEWLRSADLEQGFPVEVQRSAATLLLGIRKVIVDNGGFGSKMCVDFMVLMGKLVELLDPKGQPRLDWNALMRFINAVTKAKTEVAAYLLLGAEPPARAASDSGEAKLVEIQTLSKTLADQKRQIQSDLLDGHGLVDLESELERYLMTDGPAFYAKAKTAVEAHLEAPVDDKQTPPRALKDIYGGTFDGTDWHKHLGSTQGYAKVHSQGCKTILTISPQKYKAAVSRFSRCV